MTAITAPVLYRFQYAEAAYYPIGNRMNEMRFPYKPNIIVFLFSTLFFVGCALLLGYVALGNDRGLVLNGIIKFSTEGATIFYWCLAAVSSLFVVFGIGGIYSGLTTKKEIVLTENEIVSPKNGISKKVVSLVFSDVTDVSIQSIQKQRILSISHKGGTLTIPQSMLADKQAFDKLTSLVAARVNA